MFISEISFIPNKSQAISINKNMHDSLASSLSYIQQELFNSYLKHYCNKLDPILSFLNPKQSPLSLPAEAFGWYYNLAFALLKNNNQETIKSINNLSKIKPIDNHNPQIKNFSEYSVQEQKNMYMARLGEHDNYDFIPPSTQSYSLLENNIQKALVFFQSYIPDQYDELTTILKQIYLVTNAPNTIVFDAAAPYQLWRLLFINTNRAHSLISIIETLTHEVGHIFLFGNTIHEPLILNSKEEQFYSVFRSTKRPIDGIIHGVFVASRVCWVMDIIKTNSALPNNLRIDAQKSLDTNIYKFHQGYEVLKHNAKLSKTGKVLLDFCCEYIQSIEQTSLY